MRKYKEVIKPAVPETTQQVFSEGSCDICGKVSTEYDSFNSCFNWSEESYYHKKMVQIFLENRYNYIDSGSSQKEFFEICPDCFENKVVPFLESLGAKKYTEERDW